MLLKYCTQCASKFGKLSSGHRTGKGQFSFQSQRKAMQKNAQTTAQLHSSHMVFPVVIYGCESWNVKKAECQRIDAFELWCWRRLLRVSWTACRSNQSILKDISPGYSLEGLILKLKLQSFGHLMQRNDSLPKTLTLGKIEGKRRRECQRMRRLDSITNSMDTYFSRETKDRLELHSTPA